MTPSDFFKRLGAPLVNSRWSWGSVSKTGIVFLRVWQDSPKKHNGSLFVRITHHSKFVDNQDNLGYQERLQHLNLIRQGAKCYMVMCEAVDISASPRKMKSFDKKTVFLGGKLLQLNDNDGDWWLEISDRIDVADLVKPDN